MILFGSSNILYACGHVSCIRNSEFKQVRYDHFDGKFHYSPSKKPGSVYIWSSFVTSNSIFPGPSVPLSSTVYIRIIVGKNNRNSSKPKVWMAHFGEDFRNLIPHVDINCSLVLASQNKNKCTPRRPFLPADLLHATAPCQANLPTQRKRPAKVVH